MGRDQTRPLSVALVAICAACGAETADPGPQYITRDSAGVEIVESFRAAWTDSTAWRLSREPEVRIGTITGERAYEMSGVVGVTRMADGRIVVLDEQTKELRFFSATGEHLLTRGGGGEAPGEFNAPGGLERIAGDTLVVTDFLTRIRYTPDGDLVSESTINWYDVKRLDDYYLECGRVPHFVGENIIGCTGSRPLNRGTPEETPRGPVVYVRIPTSLDRADTLGLRGTDFVRPQRYRGDVVGLLPPLSVLRFHAFGGLEDTEDTEDTEVVSHGGHGGHGGGVQYYTGATDAYSIEVRDLDGTLRRIVRRVDGLRAVAEDERRPTPLELRGNTPESTDRFVQSLTEVDELPVVDSVSPLRGLFVDRVNRIWGRLLDPALQGGVWYDLFDADGRYLGPIPLPFHFTPLEIGEDYVLGVMKDDLDVEYVELYRIEKKSPQSPQSS